MALNFWETNIEESIRLVIEEKESCLNTLSVVYLEMSEFDASVIPDTLGQIKIEKSKEISKKSRESVKSDIQQVNNVNLPIINDLLVKPSPQHQVTTQEVVKIRDKLPLVQKTMYAF
jgi:hypothetical protein